jgi:hypothetical protein
LAVCTLSASAATITVGDATGADWSGTDFQTIASGLGTSNFELNDNNAAGVVQSFTATSDMTVGTISILAQRLVAGVNFNVDVYQFLPGDGGATYGANPDKFRLTNVDRSTLLRSYSINTSAEITSGDAGTNQFNIGLDLAEQFDVVSGIAYGIHIYSLAAGTGDRAMIWNYVNSNAYAGGTYGVPNGNVATRDLGVALTAIPEPGTYAMIFGLLALGAVIIKRRN